MNSNRTTTEEAPIGSGECLDIRRSTLPASLDSLPEAREAFLLFARQSGVPETSLPGWQLVFNEAFANAIVHGCGDDPYLTIGVEWWRDGSALCLAITDPGKGPEHDLTEPPTLPSDPMAESGRGLFIIHDFCDGHEHWAAPGQGYRQVLRKNYPSLHDPIGPDGGDPTEVDAILDELSTAYECMSAFHRFGTALVGAATSKELVEKATTTLAIIQSPSPDLILVCLSTKVLPAIREDLADLSCVVTPDATPRRAREVLADGKSIYWQSREEADDPGLALFGSGCCFPIVAGGLTLGCLVVAHRDEGNVLRPTELSTLRTFSDLLGMALANSNLQVVRNSEQRALRELELATDIQKNLLTIPPLPKSPDWEIALEHRSATEVAGDYLEARIDPEGYLVLSVIDVMGKGVSAALLASMFRTLLHREMKQALPLDALMGSINRGLAEQLENVTMFITCAMIRISPDLRSAEVANAGHCPVLVLNGEGVGREIEPTGPPLGLFRDVAHPARPILLGGDEAFLMVTDGLYEWEIDDGSCWGWENLVRLAATEAYGDATSFWSQLQTIIRTQHPDAPPKDDQTMLFWKGTAIPQAYRGDHAPHDHHENVSLPS